MSKILIIEDEEDIRDIMVELLTAHNYQVIDTEDGETGIDLAIAHHPDLIICDIMMPGIDGYEVLRQLHSHPSTQMIPFIFLTAKAAKEDMRQAMELGADDYLSKPFTGAELLGAVKIRLEKKVLLQQESEKKLDDLRKNLTRSLPHELLTPLNGILGFAKLLRDHAAEITADEIKEMSETIENSAWRLHRTIQNFLLHAQLEIMTHEPEKLQAFLAGETGSTRFILQIVAQKKAQEVERMADLSLHLAEISLPVAENWFNKIAKELIDNAFKFSETGSMVEVKSYVDSGEFILEICDRGRGMTPQQIANLGAYVQFDRKLYEQQGSGLGLVITKKLLEFYGGCLQLESYPDQGTIARAIFPLDRHSKPSGKLSH